MKALIQRVTQGGVSVSQQQVASIGCGLVVFLGIEKKDTVEQAKKLLDKVCHYRVFTDNNGKMNRSVIDCQGSLLIVSQFTLAADTNSGLRPSFSQAASPERAHNLYQYFIEQATATGLTVKTGKFGADMQVSLVNDGPVTFLLSS